MSRFFPHYKEALRRAGNGTEGKTPTIQEMQARIAELEEELAESPILQKSRLANASDEDTKPMRNQVRMEANGRFAGLLAEAVAKKGLSLRDLAVELDYTYEQMRKIWTGRSTPSRLLLRELCTMLDIPLTEAHIAATADKVERRYGANAIFGVQGRDPRVAEIEALLPRLNDQEWAQIMIFVRGYVNQKSKDR